MSALLLPMSLQKKDRSEIETRERPEVAHHIGWAWPAHQIGQDSWPAAYRRCPQWPPGTLCVGNFPTALGSTWWTVRLPSAHSYTQARHFHFLNRAWFIHKCQTRIAYFSPDAETRWKPHLDLRAGCVWLINSVGTHAVCWLIRARTFSVEEYS